jgi:hypothetical protein
MSKNNYELSERVLGEKGSLREIGVALDISKGYASMLRKARTDCAAHVIDLWRGGELPWGLVRALSKIPRKDQLEIVREYVSVLRSDATHQEVKDAALLAVHCVRELRGMAMPKEKQEEIWAEAEAIHEGKHCRIKREKITKTENAEDEVTGYWVPAMVWVPAENISTEG